MRSSTFAIAALALPALLACAGGAAAQGLAAPADLHVAVVDVPEFTGHYTAAMRWLNARSDVLRNTTLIPSVYNLTDDISAMRAGSAIINQCGALPVSELPRAAVGWSEGLDEAASETTQILAARTVTAILAGAASHDLSFKTFYPTLARAVPAEDYPGRVLAYVASLMRWGRVAVISTEGAYTTGMATRFGETCKELGVNVTFAEQVAVEPAKDDLDGVMQRLEDSGARVTLVAASRDDTSRVLLSARRAGLVSSKRAWMAAAGPPAAVLSGEASSTERRVWDGVLAQRRPGAGGADFASLAEFLGRDAGALSEQEANAAEAVLMLARAVDTMEEAAQVCAPITNATLRAQNSLCATLDLSPWVNPRILNFVKALDAQGLRGRVLLDADLDPLASADVTQYRLEAGGAVVARTVAYLDGPNGTVSRDGRVHDQFSFYGGRSTVPVAVPGEVSLERRVSDAQLVGTSAVSGLVALAALALVAFTLRHRNRKIIRMSSPHINNLSSLGCAAACGVVAAWGLSPDTDARCTARQWSLPLAFTLIFGPLFAKIYRVNAIFNASNLRVKAVRDKSLFAGVGAMLLVDAALLTAWTAAHPLRSTTRELPAEDLGDDLVNRPYVHECGGEHSAAWFGAVVAYKAALMVAGAVLAYKVRNVNIAALNDAKWVGFAIYNWVMAMAFGLPVAASLGDQPATLYAMTAGTLLFAVVGTLALVHGPKLYAIVTGTEDAWVQDASSQKTAQSAAANASKRHRRAQSGKTAPRGGRAVGPALELPRLVSAGELASSAPGSPRTPPPPLETLSEIEGEA